MKVIFMGTPEFSVQILEEVHKKYGVTLVVTQPDKVVGRKKVLTYSPVKEKALELGISVFQPRKIKEEFKPILDIKPDIIITAAYGQIIPKVILDSPEFGCINVHGSILPQLRGGAPIQRSIQRQYNTTGVTIMYMAMKMDSGDIIAQHSIPILDTDTSGTLFEKLSTIGKTLLMDTLPSIFEKTNTRKRQDENLVTYAFNLKREEEKTDFNKSKEAIDAHIRAFTPSPLVYTSMDGKQIKILKLSYDRGNDIQDDSIENGTIVVIEKDRIGVKVKNGLVYLKEVQLSGKKPQEINVFMNGAGRNLFKVNKVFK
jgi:methionyl-tRNA formyltransferase